MLKIILTALAACIAMPATAQQCSTPSRVGLVLARYDEEMIDRREKAEGDTVVVFELWANKTTKTWTIIGYIRDDSAIVCVLASGESYNGQTLGSVLFGESEA